MAMIFLVVFFPRFALDAREKATVVPYISTEALTYREIVGTDVTVRFLNCKCLFYVHVTVHRGVHVTVHRGVHMTVHRGVHVTVHRDKFLYNNQPDALISQIYFGMKLYMFRTVPLSIIRSYSLST
jgi:hypothetical protein